MEDKTLGEARWGEKERGGCYREEGKAGKGGC